MNEELKEEWLEIFENNIQGGTAKGLHDIVEEEIEYRKDAGLEWRHLTDSWDFEEMEVCQLFDDEYFQCIVCGWTQPAAQRGMQLDDICEDCDDEDEEEW